MTFDALDDEVALRNCDALDEEAFLATYERVAGRRDPASSALFERVDRAIESASRVPPAQPPALERLANQIEAIQQLRKVLALAETTLANTGDTHEFPAAERRYAGILMRNIKGEISRLEAAQDVGQE